jgi:hypothetical protein
VLKAREAKFEMRGTLQVTTNKRTPWARCATVVQLAPREKHDESVRRKDIAGTRLPVVI